MNKEEKYRLLTECSQSVRHFATYSKNQAN